MYVWIFRKLSFLTCIIVYATNRCGFCGNPLDDDEFGRLSTIPLTFIAAHSAKSPAN